MATQTGVYMQPSTHAKTFVTVYKTNVDERHQAEFILEVLEWSFTESNFHFDLKDCDRIFRMETNQDINDEVVQLFDALGHKCEVL